MEHLTKQQIILLALLVSFVSSIASGIVTVSLMGQSTPTVSQTINRVVERTIERVSPSATTTKETIIVREDQATIDAIARVSKAVARIQRNGETIALGVIISSSGTIVAETHEVYSGSLYASLDGGNIVPVNFISRDSTTGLSLFKAEQSSDPKLARVYSPVSLADSKTLKLGQTTVLVQGLDDLSVATGIVSTITAQNIRTSAKEMSVDSPAILVNLFGELIGIKDIRATDSMFIPSNVIKTYATP